MKRSAEEEERAKAPAAIARPLSKGFQVIVHGVLEGAECVEGSLLFARTQLFFGPDWSFLTTAPPRQDEAGLGKGGGVVYPTFNNNAEIVTQVADHTKSPFAYFSWAAPFEFALHSTNPHGWPQMVVTIHSVKSKGQIGESGNKDGSNLSSGETVVAYGRCFVPMCNGYHTRRASIMQMRNATARHQLFTVLTREKPVLRDVSYLCRGDDRVVLTTRPIGGHVKLTFSVMINGMEACGYEI